MFRINVNNNFHTVPQLLEKISSHLHEETSSPLLEAESTGPLSPQHSLVLQQITRQLGLIGQANAVLDAKITTALGVGGLVVALIGAVSIAGLLGSPTPLSAGGILLVFGAFFIVVAIAAFSAIPDDPLVFGSKGSMGKQRIYNTYIAVDFADSYDRVLTDYLRALEIATELNQRKIRVVRFVMLLFLLEVTGLFMAVLGS